MRSGTTVPPGVERSFWKSFGPGLLWAAAAIGVSHLVQATRAGAMAGLSLWGVILLALCLKYPFFEYGPRYAVATGESLVEGYRRIGRWAVWVFVAVAAAVAVVVHIAVLLFTAFLVNFILGTSWPLAGVAAGVLAACIGLLAIGRFRLLDLSIKIILALLGLSTMVAAAAVWRRVDLSTLPPWPLGETGAVNFPFLLALVGWMPSGFNLSVWSSLWTLAKDRQAGRRATMRDALLDFRLGYVGSALLAGAFVILGAGVMHGSGASLSSQGTAFSVQLVQMYVGVLGGWARPVVLVAIVTTMLSTALTIVDGFPRALARSLHVLTGGVPARGDERPAGSGPESCGEKAYWWIMIGIGAAAVTGIALFIGSFTTMIDVATTVSFLAAPLLGYLNLRAVRLPHVPEPHRPGRFLVGLSIAGLLLLTATAVAFIVARLL
ncbi:MAG: NRAMP family divalent metal transporter [Acidobacteriota bacterium]